MISFACFSPHPPLLLPNIGSDKDKKKVKKTIDSLENLGRKLRDINPDQIIISSPHLDWGFNVPLYFLAKNFQGEIKTYLIGLEFPEFYFKEGKNTYQKLDRNKRYALIASGDLSHCLKKEGPYGFQPDGPRFDKALIEYLRKKDIKNFLKLNDYYPQAGECGLRSFCFLLGILEESRQEWRPEILSYEGPFGVGYLVANFNLKSKNYLVSLAKTAIERYIRDGKIITPPPNLPKRWLKERSGVFVTINKNDDLRGCIGTYLPTKKNIAEEVIYNAIAAATEDYRFSPIKEKEIPYLKLIVYILKRPTPVKNLEELNPQKYGVIVKNTPLFPPKDIIFNGHFTSKTGLLLPNLKGIETSEQQVFIACQKGDIDPQKEKFFIYKFEVEKYK